MISHIFIKLFSNVLFHLLKILAEIFLFFCIYFKTFHEGRKDYTKHTYNIRLCESTFFGDRLLFFIYIVLIVLTANFIPQVFFSESSSFLNRVLEDDRQKQRIQITHVLYVRTDRNLCSFICDTYLLMSAYFRRLEENKANEIMMINSPFFLRASCKRK